MHDHRLGLPGLQRQGNLVRLRLREAARQPTRDYRLGLPRLHRQGHRARRRVRLRLRVIDFAVSIVLHRQQRTRILPPETDFHTAVLPRPQSRTERDLMHHFGPS
jgi:hypothetical protein